MHEQDRAPVPLPTADGSDREAPADEARARHAHSMLWMVVCCAPMVLIVLAILFGVFGPR